MKRFSFALCAWLFLAAPASPQEDMVKVNQIARKINDRVAWAREHGNVLTEVEALKALESEYARDEQAQGFLREMISQLLPQIGAYEEAHRYADLASGMEAAAGPTRIDGYTPVNALQALAAASADRQIVMINEAHHVPQHRAFTLQLHPLTINQYWMTEHSAPEFEEPVYRWATGNGLFSEAVVFRNAAGDLWTLHAGFDVAVFHPRSRNEDGRPAWLRLGGLRSPLPLLVWVCGTAPRCLVTARSAAEGADAIPLDQIVVEAGKPVPALLLPPGKYVIRVEDAQGKLIRENVQPSGGAYGR
jgi:hypothetical protein